MIKQTLRNGYNLNCLTTCFGKEKKRRNLVLNCETWSESFQTVPVVNYLVIQRLLQMIIIYIISLIII